MYQQLNLKAIFLIILFFLSPFISAIISMVLFLRYPRNKFYSIISIAFLVLIAFSGYIDTTADVYRHYNRFFQLKDFNWNQTKEYLKIQPDILIYIYYKLIGIITSNKQYIHILPAVLVYSVPFLFLREIKINFQLSTFTFGSYIFVFFGMFVNFESWVRMRTPIAYFLIYISSYKIFFQNNKKYFIGLLLAPLFHSSMLPVSLIMILVPKLKFIKLNKKLIKVCFIVAVVFLILPSEIFRNQILNISRYFPVGLQYKIEANFGKYYGVKQNLVVLENLKRIVGLTNILFFYNILKKKFPNKKNLKNYTKILLVLTVFVSIFYKTSDVTGERFLGITSILCLIYNIFIIEIFNIKKIRKIYSVTLYFIGILYIFINLIFSGPIINEKVLVYTLPQILAIKIEESERMRVTKFYDSIRIFVTGESKFY